MLAWKTCTLSVIHLPSLGHTGAGGGGGGQVLTSTSDPLVLTSMSLMRTVGAQANSGCQRREAMQREEHCICSHVLSAHIRFYFFLSKIGSHYVSLAGLEVTL